MHVGRVDGPVQTSRLFPIWRSFRVRENVAHQGSESYCTQRPTVTFLRYLCSSVLQFVLHYVRILTSLSPAFQLLTPIEREAHSHQWQ